MKNINEIILMLVSELTSHLDKIKSIKEPLVYFNEILGDTSFLLAGLLESLLKKRFNEWDNRRWIDDSLVTKTIMVNNKLKIEGVMIWGMKNTTDQWTEPFIFEIELLNEEVNYREFVFLFGDLDKAEITYEEFRDNRSYWTVNNRNWRYIIKSSEF